MLGQRDSQSSLFGCDQIFRSLVGEETFYVYLADRRHELFRDEDFAMLYCSNNGRPSIPPSILAVALLLQWYDNVSDEEAARRAKLDLSWKVALGIELMDIPFVKSVLCEFRNTLIIHKQQKYFFELSLKQARMQGFFKARNIKVALDTTPIFGKGAVQDTYNMLAEGLRQLLCVLAKLSSQSVEDYATLHDFRRYTAPSFKGTYAIDWDNEQERSTVLESLVADCDRILLLARNTLSAHNPESREAAEILKASELLSRLLTQDVKRTADGRPELLQGVSPDRIVSVHDPEMRHGHKSAHQRFDGFKGAVAVDPGTQLVTALDVLPAAAPDGGSSAALIRETSQTTGASVDTVLGDTAYGTAEQRLAAKDHYQIVAPVPRTPRTGRFTKDVFTIDIEKQTVTCPAGKRTQLCYRRTTTTKSGHRFSNKEFRFAQTDCVACPLRTQCIAPGVPRRTILVHAQEGLLQEAKRFQRTEDFRTLYRMRVAVEHRIARMVQLGLRNARYFGSTKVLFQLAMTAAVANLTLIAAGINEHPSPLLLSLVLTVGQLLIFALPLKSSVCTHYFTPAQPKNRGFQLSF